MNGFHVSIQSQKSFTKVFVILLGTNIKSNDYAAHSVFLK